MAPRKPKRAKAEPQSNRGGANEVVAQGAASSEANIENEGFPLEREYHTDESDSDAYSEDANTVPRHAPPYLPAHLLEFTSTSESFAPPRLSVPYDELTKQQRRNIRKRKWNTEQNKLRKLKAEAQANGVLAAGKAAQIKRNVLPKSNRVRSGRVGKKRKPERVEVSGRQRILEQRKRRLEQLGQVVPAEKVKKVKNRAKT